MFRLKPLAFLTLLLAARCDSEPAIYSEDVRLEGIFFPEIKEADIVQDKSVYDINDAFSQETDFQDIVTKEDAVDLIADTQNDFPDVADIPDSPDLPDSSDSADLYEIPKDDGFAIDTGCKNGNECPQGYTCEYGVCEPCNTPLACGIECVKCEGGTPYCAGGKCVECDDDYQCGGLGFFCDSGACATCKNDDPKHCGDDCEVCVGTKPACSGGNCVCVEGSCEKGKLCADGECVVCNTDSACGLDCQPCAPPLPFCHSSGQTCVECIDNTPCAEKFHCENGFCAPDCAVSGCGGDNAPDGKTCAKAKIVGRLQAAAGFVFNGDTTGDGNDDSHNDCWDAKYDNFFRIYLVKGEILNVTLSPNEWDFDASLKLYQGTVCNKGGDPLLACEDSAWDGDPEVLSNFAVSSDGWHTVVVDGEMAFDDDYDYGSYTLEIKLACKEAGCCCN